MAGSIHIWAGVADRGLAGAASSLAMHTLVARAESGATGFDRDPVGNAALAALADELYLVRPDTGAAEHIGSKPDPIAIIRPAMKPRAYVVVRPGEAFAPLCGELADYRKALAKKALSERMGKPFQAPAEPALLGLFEETASEPALSRLAAACEAVLVFRFAGEWGIAPTLVATGDQGEVELRKLATAGISVVRVARERELPMW